VKMQWPHRDWHFWVLSGISLLAMVGMWLECVPQRIMYWKFDPQYSHNGRCGQTFNKENLVGRYCWTCPVLTLASCLYSLLFFGCTGV
jgi:hypothetical protein